MFNTYNNNNNNNNIQKDDKPTTVKEWQKVYKTFQEQFPESEDRIKEFERIRNVTKDEQNCISVVLHWHKNSKSVLPLEKRKFLVQNNVKLEELYQNIRQLAKFEGYNRNQELFFFANEEQIANTNIPISKIHQEFANLDDKILYIVYSDSSQVYEN